MRERIGCIMDLGFDPGPPTQSVPLEHALTALVSGQAEPVQSTGQLIAPVELAVAQLFHLRDQEA